MINYLAQHPNNKVKSVLRIFEEYGEIPNEQGLAQISDRAGKSNVEAAVKIFKRKAKVSK